MGRPLLVLIVEDSEDDTLLLLRYLRHSGYDPQYERVDTPEAMRAALARQTWDIIFSDHTMPHFNAPAALKLLKESGLDIPFIIVSGSIGEEQAVTVMKAGAQDYIIKNNLTRLAPTIERELHEAQVRQARQHTEEALKRAAQEWRDTFDAVSDAIFLTDRENKVIRCNRSLTDLLGKPFSQIIGHHCYQLIHGTSEPIAGCLFHRLRNTLRRETTIFPLGDRWLNVAADPLLDESGGVSGTIHIMSDITVLKKAEEKLEQSLKKLQNTLEGTISALAKMVETRDLYTAGHQQRVAQLASAIAGEMGLPPEQIEGLRIAALLHDIGKISVPAEILSKPGQLTRMEFSIIKTHPEVSYDILKTIDFPYPVSQIVLQHHERMNGSGYPQGLSGENIIQEARILAVADVVEAMSSHRPYRAAPGVNKAIETISRSRGILYDDRVVDACLRLFTEKGFQFE